MKNGYESANPTPYGVEKRSNKREIGEVRFSAGLEGIITQTTQRSARLPPVLSRESK
jgi:hypothetical protein